MDRALSEAERTEVQSMINPISQKQKTLEENHNNLRHLVETMRGALDDLYRKIYKIEDELGIPDSAPSYDPDSVPHHKP